jgi:hypothetical protein
MTQKGTKKLLSEIATLKKKFGGSKILTRIAIHILVNKTEKSFSNLATSQFCFSRSNKSTTTLQF